ncbi:V-set and Ig domain-containing protein [Pimephales promelas]|uniref:V-set and Ig domain-containing protein n=1 Tax=Pimephales promelas TaxID=90988 RepID=UPI00195567CB|nr:V-set and Ig domain-containing protein [Pimephales promelas]KAG1936619.1 sialic acid-binding Ig-like lectin [Pimephales promelas]
MSAMEVQRFSKTLGLLVVLHSAAIAKDDDGWLMKAPTEVRAIEGYPVVLPCSFTHPHHTHPSSMHVVWTLGHGRAATVLFRCTSLNNSQQCQSKINQDNRYRLEGNHRNHDISLRINSVTLKDSDRYYCRVELAAHPHTSFENKLGTRLRVEAAPRILSLSAEGTETSGFKAVCRVQGSPLPDVQWIAPDGVEGDTSFLLSQEATGQYRTSSQLLDVKPGGQYICAASNSLGKDQATLYVLPLSPERSTAKSSFSLLVLLLALALGTKLLLALGVGAWVIKRRFNSSVDH